MNHATPQCSSPPLSYRLRDLPEGLRPRELVDRMGFEGVPEDVLLALVLRSGVRGRNVVEVARDLIRHYGSLAGLAQASVDDLREREGIGPVKARELKAALELARRLSGATNGERVTIRTPDDAARLLRETARPLTAETFWVLHLNARNCLKGRPLEVSRGVLDGSLVHPREVFREAVRAACAAIVLVHNHPSGDPAPSAEDVRITRQLIQAGKVVDIQVMDHIILGKTPEEGGRDFFSLREAGIVDFG